MDEEKKSESSEVEVDQVGPYQLREQVPQDEYTQGELYRATHETSGAMALVLKPATEDEKGSVPLTDWRVRVNSSASQLCSPGGGAHPKVRGPRQALGGIAGVHLGGCTRGCGAHGRCSPRIQRVAPVVAPGAGVSGGCDARGGATAGYGGACCQGAGARGGHEAYVGHGRQCGPCASPLWRGAAPGERSEEGALYGGA
jgi:hypothetical protein